MTKRRRLFRRKSPTRSFGGDIGINLLLLFFGFFMVLPMVYTVSNAFKPFDELWVYPPRFFPRVATGKNFRDVFRLMANGDVPFLRYVFNTVFISLCGTLGHLLLASAAAYALSSGARMSKTRCRAPSALPSKRIHSRPIPAASP